MFHCGSFPRIELAIPKSSPARKIHPDPTTTKKNFAIQVTSIFLKIWYFDAGKTVQTGAGIKKVPHMSICNDRHPFLASTL
jgi:hypothetical protein